MKRKSVLTIAASAALILSLTACGSAAQTGQAPAPSPAVSTTAESTETTKPEAVPAETETASINMSTTSNLPEEASAEADTASISTAAPAASDGNTASVSTEAAAASGGDTVVPAEAAGDEADAGHTASITTVDDASAAASSEADGTDETATAAEAAETAAADAGAQEAVIVHVNDLQISVPKVYYDQLVIQSPHGRDDGVFLTVSEKASIEAASDDDGTNEGAGWLFSLSQINEDTLRQLLCEDMSGHEVFAFGDDGSYYVYNHPTDVRYMRESVEQMTADQDKWSALCEWAGSIPERVVLQNSGLTPVKHTNTNLDITLARIAYTNGVKYTISTTAHDPMEPADVDPAPYVSRLVNGVTFEYAYDEEDPDGDSVVLNLPEEGVHYDFFLAEGKENYVREVHGDYSILYKAVFESKDSTASAIMNEWYEALVKKAAK